MIIRAECQRCRDLLDSYVSNELMVETALEVVRHLDECHACRAEADGRRRLRDQFRDALREERAPRALVDRVTKVLAAGAPSRVGLWFGMRGAVLALALLSLGVMSLIVFWQSSTDLSAAELLAQSTRMEREVADAMLHQVLDVEELRLPARSVVSRRRVQIWRRGNGQTIARRLYGDGGRIEAGEWRRPDGTTVVYERDRPPRSVASAELPSNGLEVWRLDLTAAAFSLIVPVDRATVEPSEQGYRIRYRGDGRPIVDAVILLSIADLHPIAQTLVVSRADGEHELRFTEASHERLDMATFDRSILEPDAELSSRRMVTPVDASNARPALPARAPSRAALVGLEIDALQQLDAAGLLLGQLVEVTRSATGLLVHAVVDGDAQARSIRDSIGRLANTPHVRVDVRTAADASPSAVRPPQMMVRGVEVGAAVPPAYEALRAYLLARRAEPIDEEALQSAGRDYGRRVLDRSREALLHAGVLKDLARRFSSDELDQMSDSARGRWQVMLIQHAQDVQRHTALLRLDLQPVFFRVPPVDAAELADDGLPLVGLADQLLTFASAHDDAIRSAFTVSDAPPAQMTFRSDAFWQSLRSAEELAVRIQRYKELPR